MISVSTFEIRKFMLETVHNMKAHGATATREEFANTVFRLLIGDSYICARLYIEEHMLDVEDMRELHAELNDNVVAHLYTFIGKLVNMLSGNEPMEPSITMNLQVPILILQCHFAVVARSGITDPMIHVHRVADLLAEQEASTKKKFMDVAGSLPSQFFKGEDSGNKEEGRSEEGSGQTKEDSFETQDRSRPRTEGERGAREAGGQAVGGEVGGGQGEGSPGEEEGSTTEGRRRYH